LRLARVPRDSIAAHSLEIAEVARLADQFDVVHFHTDFLHFPVARQLTTPHVTTLHGRLDLPDLPSLYDEFCDIPVISISNSQRRPLPQANWLATVYNGVPAQTYTFQPRGGDYLAFVGRVSPEKGLDSAIEIAKQVGLPLRIGAKVDPADREYFENHVRPLLEHPLVEFIGEVNEQEKSELFGGARATLFPINWPEPFGLVMIESMACGTPVIAFPHGSVPEVMRDGVSGFIVEDVPAAVAALGRIDDIDRAGCRRHFEEQFTADRMAQRYVQAYAKACRAAGRKTPATSINRVPSRVIAAAGETALN
jgi:glycosyltransferase involved in cell wall biosynthesis